MSQLSDADYQRLSHAVLSSIEATVDRWLQDDVIDIDPQRTGGLLELSFPDGSKIVVNTQPPLHELWLAARGGGFHFRWEGALGRHARRRRIFRAPVGRGHGPGTPAAALHAAGLRAGTPARSAPEQIEDAVALLGRGGRGGALSRPTLRTPPPPLNSS
jgi:CyaY protein